MSEQCINGRIFFSPIMSSNPSQGELGVCSTSVQVALKLTILIDSALLC